MKQSTKKRLCSNRLALSRGHALVALGWLVTIVLLSACRIPPPPVSTDLSEIYRPWQREQSDAMRALVDHAPQHRRPQLHVSSDVSGTVCDEHPTDLASLPFVHADEADQSLFTTHLPATADANALTLTSSAAVVDEVLRVNPSLESAEHSWLAAMELYPQATSFDDPSFRFLNGPTIFGSSSGQHLWRLEVRQKLPWYGKRGLRGELADHQADLAYHAWRRSRDQLASTARKTYGQLVLAEQLYALSMQEHQLTVAMLDPATIELASGTTQAITTDDPLELERLQLEHKQQQIIDNRQLAHERMNALLKRDLSAPLVVAGNTLNPPRSFPQEETLIAEARMHSPDLAAARKQEQQAESAVLLAEKEFYPDVEVVGRFDTNANEFWAPDRANIRPQLGVAFPMMIQHRKRWARLRQMQFERQRRRAETRAVEAKIKADVQRAIVQINRAQQRLASLDRLLAAAERRLESQIALVSHDPTTRRQMLASQRDFIKYQIELARETAALDDCFTDLAVLCGTATDASPDDHTIRLNQLETDHAAGIDDDHTAADENSPLPLPTPPSLQRLPTPP